MPPRINAPLGRRDRMAAGTVDSPIRDAAAPGATRRPPRGTRLDDPAFVAAARTIDTVMAGLRSRSVRGFAVRPAAVRDAVRVVRHLPRLPATLTHEPVGRAIAGRLNSRELGLRSHVLAQAVLTVPDDLDAYLQGRPRQGLRNKLSRARAAGITTGIVSAAEGTAAHAEITRSRGGEAAGVDTWPVDPALLTWLVARDPDGVPLAVMCLIVDRDVALLKMFHAVQETRVSSPARHALHQELVGCLARSGQRLLIGDSALRIGDGLRTFLHGLGYQAYHVRPTTHVPQSASA